LPVSFRRCTSSGSNIVGKVGLGYKYAIEALNEGRIGIGAQMIGLAQGVVDHAVKYTFTAQTSSARPFLRIRPAASDAQVATEIAAARLLVYNAARLRECKAPFIKEAAMAKLYGVKLPTMLLREPSNGWEASDSHVTNPIEKYYRDVKVSSPYGERVTFN